MTRRNHQATPADEFALPVCLDEEQFLLGGLIHNNDLFLQVADKLKAGDFGLEKHKLIFSAICEMLGEKHESVSPRSLANLLQERDELRSVDGLSYLVTLGETDLTAASVVNYTTAIKESALRRQLMCLARDVSIRAAGKEPLGDLLESMQAGILALANPSTPQQLEPISSIIDTYPGGINTLVDPAKRAKGTSTGISKLDQITGGLRGGELIILAARTGFGKSALSSGIGQHIATRRQNPKAVALFSMEMSKESLLTRMLCAGGRVDQQRFRGCYIGQEERRRLAEAASDLYNAPLYIDDTSVMTLYDMRVKLDRLIASGVDLGLVIVDYLQLMEGPKAENRTQAVSALARGLKLMSGALHVPFLVLSQLGRGPETRQDHTPMLSDLRESGEIEQSADVVAFIFREEVYRPDKESLKGIAEIILAKQRNGPTGRFKLAWLNKFTKFENLAEELGESDPYQPDSIDNQYGDPRAAADLFHLEDNH